VLLQNWSNETYRDTSRYSDQNNTRFFVYTSDAPTTAHEIIPKNATTHTVVAQGKPLAIIVHGFTNNGQSPNLLTLKTSLLKSGHVPTVIITDWEKGAASPWYTEASVNTQLVGHQVANLVNHLKTSRGIDPAQVHLLGFSLGAQVSGYAGKFAQSEYKWKIGRISAMDSAAPLFEGHPGSYLTEADATFVDAIHTSAGASLLTGEVGFVIPIGHVDFYPNGGAHQPHCAGKISLSCNHGSSVLYMDASLSAAAKCEFRAFKCATYAEYTSKKCADTKGDSRMGYPSASLTGRGTHYLNTTAEYPFC